MESERDTAVMCIAMLRSKIQISTFGTCAKTVRACCVVTDPTPTMASSVLKNKPKRKQHQFCW